MVELICAMGVMSIGILAVFAMFQSGMVQLRRASSVSTAAALADSEMEKFRAVKYNVIGLDDADVAAADATYKADGAYRSEATPTTSLSAATTDAATSLTVASFAGFPTAAPYRIKVDNEIMIVEGGAGTVTWTVKRGVDATVAAAHNGGATVRQKKLVHVVKCGVAPCTSSLPTRTVTGADGKSYRLDTYTTWQTVVNANNTTGRNVKLITLVVRDATTGRLYARVASSFDESTGL